MKIYCMKKKLTKEVEVKYGGRRGRMGKVSTERAFEAIDSFCSAMFF